LTFDRTVFDGRENLVGDAKSDRDVPAITWIGHSTVLLELDGVRLITDPVLRSRIFYVRRVGPDAPPGTLDDLDAALVSHLHYDHLDTPSLTRLGRSLRVVAPLGSGKLLRRRGFTDVTEVDVGDEARVGAVSITATHAEHDGRRGLFGTAVPAVGFIVSGSVRVYFAGDTDLFDDMRTLADGLDVALLPVAGWGPRLPPGHLDPLGAAEALALLRPRTAVPIHWGTYRRMGLSSDPAELRAPAESFAEAARELAPDVDVRILPVGGRLELPLRSEGGELAGGRTHTGASA
jgi:L-ascorbate metabolism protein UlaG (beta-lactamase superfamily)